VIRLVILSYGHCWRHTSELLNKEDVPHQDGVSAVDQYAHGKKSHMNASLRKNCCRFFADARVQMPSFFLIYKYCRISLAQRDEAGICGNDRRELQFQLVLNAILNLFIKDRQLLETKGQTIHSQRFFAFCSDASERS
jgi:hypothetical protein